LEVGALAGRVARVDAAVALVGAGLVVGHPYPAVGVPVDTVDLAGERDRLSTDIEAHGLIGCELLLRTDRGPALGAFGHIAREPLLEGREHGGAVPVPQLREPAGRCVVG